MRKIGPYMISPLVSNGAVLNLLQSTKDKLLFYGLYSEIAAGKMPNKLGIDWLTVAGVAGSETYQAPNTAPYIAADTDYIWFNHDGATQRTTTTAELVGYDLQRTPVKYDDNTPYQIREIAIIKAGETLTAEELNNLFKVFWLPVLWNNSLNAFGHVKGNRITQNLWPILGAEQVVNGVTFIDSNADGLANSWTKQTDNTTATIVNGNGFIGNAQRCVAVITGILGIYQTKTGLQNITVSCSITYRSDVAFWLQVPGGVTKRVSCPINTGDAVTVSGIIATGSTDNFIQIFVTSAAAGKFIEFNNVSVKIKY